MVHPANASSGLFGSADRFHSEMQELGLHFGSLGQIHRFQRKMKISDFLVIVTLLGCFGREVNIFAPSDLSTVPIALDDFYMRISMLPDAQS